MIELTGEGKCTFNMYNSTKTANKKDKKKGISSPAGFEPATSGLEVQRAIHCATGTSDGTNYPVQCSLVLFSSIYAPLALPCSCENWIGSVYIIRALSSEFVSSSIPSWQILTAHAQPLRGARDLAFCLKVPLDSLLVWASSEGSGETARMRRLAWTFAGRIGDKYQIRLTQSIKYSGIGARRRVVHVHIYTHTGGCRTCHYLSWTDSVNPSMLFSNFGCCISKGSSLQIIFGTWQCLAP